MRMTRLSLLAPLLALDGCEAIGPNEIATWDLFHRDRAAILYTTAPVGGTADLGADGSPGRMVGDTHFYSIDSANLANVVTASSAPYNDVLQATPLGFEFIPDPDDLGPAPQFPIIDIAAISRAVETSGERSAAPSRSGNVIQQGQANDW